MNEAALLKSLNSKNPERSRMVQAEEKGEREKCLKCPRSTSPPVSSSKESSKRRVKVETMGKHESGSSTWLKAMDSANSKKVYSRWLIDMKTPVKTLNLGTRGRHEKLESGPKSDLKLEGGVIGEVGRKFRQSSAPMKALHLMKEAEMERSMKRTSIPLRPTMTSMARPAVTGTHSLPRR